jgi:hypothetical protein
VTKSLALGVAIVIIGLGARLPASEAQAIIRAPGARIVVVDTGGPPSFEFVQQENPTSKNAHNVPAKSLTIRRAQDGAIVWQVYAGTGSGAWRIDYGEVPEGLEQDVPRRDFAPALEPGVTYVVEAIVGNTARSSASATFTFRPR